MTFLAFIYVPLNLVTSIFGMNIQQLNGSGQHIWIFVLTALLALLLTYLVWLGIGLYKEYVQWRKQLGTHASPEIAKRGRKYNFVIRTAILIVLLWKGHGRWVWVTGAWIRILTNERIKAHHPPPKADSHEFPYWRHMARLDEWTACDYVSYYNPLVSANDYYFNPRNYL